MTDTSTPRAMPMPPRVVDAHHHLWDFERGAYPWLQGPAQDPDDPSGLGPLQRTYLVPDLLADAGAVPLVASVHVEAAWHPDSQVEETRWLHHVAHRDGFPHAYVAGVQLEKPDAGDVLDAHLEIVPIRGVRQMLDWDPRPGATAQPPTLLSDPVWRRGLRLLAERGLSFELQVLPEQLEQATEIVAAHPQTLFVLNHGGLHVPRSAATEAAWRHGITRLAQYPNVVVKSSGYDAVDPTWEPGAFRDYLRTLLEVFGVERVLFASNFPFDRRTISYEDLVRLSAWALADLAEAQRDAYFAGNAIRVYQLDMHDGGSPTAGQPSPTGRT